MAGKNNAKLYDPALFIAMGIDPKTKLPIKWGGSSEGASFKPHNLRLLTEIDRADALNRFKWYNLPNSLNQQLIESVLYYRGQGAFFYMKENDKFYFLPYTLSAPDNGSGLDCYGRYLYITPMMFNGSFDEEPKPFIRGLVKKPHYEIKLNSLTMEDLDDGCVLLHDRSYGLTQTIAPRSSLQLPLLDLMSDIPCYLRTSLKNQTGVQGLRVPTEAARGEVYAANKAIDNATISGNWAVPVVGEIEFQPLTGQPTTAATEYLLTMQALDSYRLSMYGLPNGGLFQKRSNMLESEHNMNTGTAALVLQDDLRQRQEFCDIVNSIYGLNIWCDINESVTQIDRDMDGDMYSNEPNTTSHESAEPTTIEGGSEE